MTGNVATLEGFNDVADWGADSIRVGVGGGCFVPGTLVRTEHGEKPIEDVGVGDRVYTHTGELKPVVDTMTFDRNEEIMAIDSIECTKNHEFYVVNKADASLVTEENIHEYAYWVEASKLNKNLHLLIELEE